jgi:hypothetical protein
MRCLVGALGLRLRRGMGYLGVLFMGFLPRNTVTTVNIFVVLRNEHTFTILCNSFLCHAHAAADFVKRASYCSMFLFLQISRLYFFVAGWIFITLNLYFRYNGIRYIFYIKKSSKLVGSRKKFRFTEHFVTLAFVKTTFH